MLQLAAVLLYLSVIISLSAWKQTLASDPSASAFVAAVHVPLILLCIVMWAVGEESEE